MEREIHPPPPEVVRLMLVCRVRLYSKALCDLLRAEPGVGYIVEAAPDGDPAARLSMQHGLRRTWCARGHRSACWASARP